VLFPPEPLRAIILLKIHWKMVEYARMTGESCIFCKIANKEIASRIVFEDDEALAFQDINPQAPVHVVVISKRHIEKLTDLKESDAALAGKLILVCRDIAKTENCEGSGYRVVINTNRDAGQSVFHLHAHLLGGRRFVWPPG